MKCERNFSKNRGEGQDFFEILQVGQNARPQEISLPPARKPTRGQPLACYLIMSVWQRRIVGRRFNLQSWIQVLLTCEFLFGDHVNFAIKSVAPAINFFRSLALKQKVAVMADVPDG